MSTPRRLLQNVNISAGRKNFRRKDFDNARKDGFFYSISGGGIALYVIAI